MKTKHWDRIGNGGLTFTELGFGTAPLGNLYRAISDADARATLDAAWDAGLRYYDTAPLYGLGLSETRLNPFLRAHPRGEVRSRPRSAACSRSSRRRSAPASASSSTSPSRREVYDYSHDGILRSLELSLERLGLDSVDILYVHDLDMQVHGTRAESDRRVAQFMASGYDALVRLRDEGVIRAFGAGLNEWQVCEDLARRGDFDLFLLAGRYTLLEQEALNSLSAALRRAQHRHRPRRPLQLRHPRHRRPARRLLRLRAGPGGDPRARRRHRARLRRPRRAARDRGAAVPAPPPGGGLGHPRRPEAGRGRRQRRRPRHRGPARALGRPQDRGPAARGRAHHLNDGLLPGPGKRLVALSGPLL